MTRKTGGQWDTLKRKMPSEVTATMETEPGQPPPPSEVVKDIDITKPI